jgi:hypothetical protein
MQTFRLSNSSMHLNSYVTMFPKKGTFLNFDINKPSLNNGFNSPTEAIYYARDKEIETLNRFRRYIAEKRTSKLRLEMQRVRILDNIKTLEEERKRIQNLSAEKSIRERKEANLRQMRVVETAIANVHIRLDKLEVIEKNFSESVEVFRSGIEVMLALHAARKVRLSSEEICLSSEENIADLQNEFKEIGQMGDRYYNLDGNT